MARRNRTGAVAHPREDVDGAASLQVNRGGIHAFQVDAEGLGELLVQGSDLGPRRREPFGFVLGPHLVEAQAALA